MTKREIFLRAQLASNVQERTRILDEACCHNPELRAEIESLLDYDLDDDFLEHAAVSSSLDPVLGSTIGPYKVLQEIGEGGMGVVYMAEQRQPMARRVAIKIVKQGMDTRQVVARFEAERQALALMDHPNIARVIDAGTVTQTGDRPYFVMELVRGISITEFCDENRLSTRDRLGLLAQVCRGVHHAHQKGIIHRDIKPSNILVTMIDGRPVPKIIDFGIAKAINFRLTERTLFTELRHFVGTPLYVSPEQMEMSGQDIDTRSDIYSLGVLFYELLTGSTPIEKETLKRAAYAEIQRLVVEVEPPKPSLRLSTLKAERLRDISKLRDCEPGRLRKLVRGELDWIAMKALEKDRSRRYDSAAGLAQDIDRFLRHEPVSAVRPSALYVLSKLARRNKAWLAAAGLVLATLILGTAVSVWQAVRAHREANDRALEAARAQSAENKAKVMADRAAAGEMAARHSLYLSDMIFAQASVRSGNIERAVQILEDHIPEPGQEDLRDFEWRYLWGQTHRELFTLLADDEPNDDISADPVRDLSLCAQNNLLASASRDGRIRVWDLGARRELFRFDIEAGGLCWISFSREGKYLACGGESWRGPTPEVAVWDVAQRREFRRFSVKSAEFVLDVQFAPDGQLVAAAQDGSVWFWNVETGEVIETAWEHQGPAQALSVARQATRMASLGPQAIHIWDWAQHKILQTIIHDRKYAEVAISHDGKWLAASQRPVPRITVLESRTGEPQKEIELKYFCQTAEFSMDGSKLAVLEIGGAIRIFNTSSWEEITTYQHSGHQLNTMALSDNGRILVSAGDNGTIMAWPGLVNLEPVVLPASAWVVTGVKYSSDGRTLAVGNGDGSVDVWDAASQQLLFTTPEQASTNNKFLEEVYEKSFFALSPDGDELAVPTQLDSENFGVAFWNMEGRRETPPLPVPRGRVGSLAYSPDGRLLATGSMSGGVIQIWDLTTRQTINPPMSDGGGWVLCMTFSPNSKWLATEGYGRLGIHVWDIATGNYVAILKKHVEPVGDNQAVLFSPDGAWLATAGYDGKVILWNTSTWQPEKILLGHGVIVMDLSFSADSKRLASSGVDNSCILWDVASGREVARFRGYAVDFAPDGTTLAVGGFYYLPFDEAPTDSRTVRLYRSPPLAEIAQSFPMPSSGP